MDRNIITVFSIFLLKWTVANGLTEDRVPDPPENVHVRTTSNSATLWWDPPTNGDTVMVRGYAVAYGIGTPTSKIVIEGSNTYSFTINRLKPSTEYVFAVNAYNEAEGEDGEKVLMTAMTQTNTEGESSSFSLWPPIAVRAITKDRGVEVGWEDPNPERNEENSLATTTLRHYIVQYGIYQSENLQKVRSNSRSVLLNNLLPGREYEIAVKVVDSDGRESPWSIRDIVLTPHDTPSEISRYDWLCDFEKDQCGLKSVGHIHWLRTHRKDNPGPFEGSHYLTLDPHPSNTRSARLVTLTFNMQRSNKLCLQFAFYMRESHDGVFSVGLEDERTFLVTDVLKIDVGKLPKGRWVPVKLNVGSQKTPFKISFKITWKSEGPWTGLDSIGLSSGVCSGIEENGEMKVLIDQESEVDLLVPVEGALNSDPRVFRAKGIDGLPAIGIQRGVEIVVPYRLYLPRKFFKEFSILVSVKPSDRRGGYLFAVVNPFDTIVDVGVLIEPAGQSQTNISFIYSNSRTDTHSKAIASFLVPEFVQQWAQFALEVTRDEVVLYFKCVRFSARQVSRIPEQLVMDDAHKLYIGSGGPLIGGGFEVR